MNRSKASRPAKSRSVKSHAAGIDIGSRHHYVSVGEGQPVRRFGCFTEDLHAMSSWLKECEVTTVAMEATGVYWIPAYQILDADGFEVLLVDTRQVKNARGRKTDVQDCQWIQHLHANGILTGAFRPADRIVVMRSYMRQRLNLTQEASRHLQRMQKALEQMNIQLHKVIEQIAGQTGMAIIGAIVRGERDPEKLADLRNYRVRRTRRDFIAALTGDWREEHLFCLKQAWAIYHELQTHIAECDAEIERHYTSLPSTADEQAAPPPAKDPKHDTMLRQHLFRILGVDATAIPGLSPEAVVTIVSEVGTDMAKWPSADHFASWLRLCPDNHITGGRRYHVRRPIQRNRAALVFRRCAANLARSQSFFGAFYRRMRGRKGGKFATTATAAKLAKVFYLIVSSRVHYRELGFNHYDEAHRQRVVRSTIARLNRLGYEVNLNVKPSREETADAVP